MKKLTLVAVALAVVLPSVASAADYTVPAVVSEYGNVLFSIVGGVLAGVIIMIMLLKGGWEMFANANSSPVKWALAGAIVIGGAIFFAPKMVGFAQGQFDNNTTGSSTATVTVTE